MIMVTFTFADIKIEKLAFRIKNVLDVDNSSTLMKITGQFRESIFHWTGIWANLMSVMRGFTNKYFLIKIAHEGCQTRIV
jgi:hypothetical protein